MDGWMDNEWMDGWMMNGQTVVAAFCGVATAFYFAVFPVLDPSQDYNSVT